MGSFSSKFWNPGKDFTKEASFKQAMQGLFFERELERKGPGGVKIDQQLSILLKFIGNRWDIDHF